MTYAKYGRNIIPTQRFFCCELDWFGVKSTELLFLISCCLSSFISINRFLSSSVSLRFISIIGCGFYWVIIRPSLSLSALWSSLSVPQSLVAIHPANFPIRLGFLASTFYSSCVSPILVLMLTGRPLLTS